MVRQFSLIALLLLCLGGHASAAVVLDSPVVELTDFAMATFVDETETMAFETVRSQAFTPSSNRVSLGPRPGPPGRASDWSTTRVRTLSCSCTTPTPTTIARSPSSWRIAILWWTASSLAALIMDIDHFKAVNDSHGHAVGDRVLVELARVLRNGSRSSDLIARFGGE